METAMTVMSIMTIFLGGACFGLWLAKKIHKFYKS